MRVVIHEQDDREMESVRKVLRNKRGLQVEVIGGSDTGQGSPFVFRNIIVLH